MATAPMPILTPRSRSGIPPKRPPYIIGAAAGTERFRGERGLVQAPPLPDSAAASPEFDVDDVDLPLRRGSRFRWHPPRAQSALPWLTGGMEPRDAETARAQSAVPWLAPGRDSRAQSATPHSPEPDRAQSVSPTFGAASEVPTEGHAPRTGGRASRTNNCYLTHTYLKQEVAYLSRRVDEVTRYFLVLEGLIGTGSLGPALEKSLKDFERELEAVNSMEDVDHVQSLIDAAVRLGLSPKRYAPLQERKELLVRGRRQAQLRAAICEVDSITDPRFLRQLIDDSLRHELSSNELENARRRLRKLEQIEWDEEMFEFAASGDVAGVASSIRRGADCGAQRQGDGASLWHVAAEGRMPLARLLSRLGAPVDLTDKSGFTALMLASRWRCSSIVKELLLTSADPSQCSAPAEHFVAAETASDVEQILALVGSTRRLEQPLNCDARARLTDGGILQTEWSSENILTVDAGCALGLDVGDELLAGEELQLPLFRRVGGRTALHVALLRATAWADSSLTATIQELLNYRVAVDVCDEIGRSPLWYAAHAGNAVILDMLLRAGASIPLDAKIYPLRAAANKHCTLTSAGNSVEAVYFLNACRTLIKHGAQIDANSPEFTPSLTACLRRQEMDDVEIAVEMSLSEISIADHRAWSLEFAKRYNTRFLAQRCHGLSTAELAADFAASALPEFRSLAAQLAYRTCSDLKCGRPPTSARLKRLARSYGVPEQVASGSTDWAFIVGATQCVLVFDRAASLYQALPDIENHCRHRIRSVTDTLLLGAEQNSSQDSGSSPVSSRTTLGQRARFVGRAPSRFLTGRILKPESNGEGIPRREVRIYLEVSGVICLIRLRVRRVADAEQKKLADGTWFYLEMQESIVRGSFDDVNDILDYADEAIDDDMCFKAVLNMQLDGQPLVSMAIRAGRVEIADALLKRKASANCRESDGTSPLKLATQNCDFSCFSLLLRSGADPVLEESRSLGDGGTVFQKLRSSGEAGVAFEKLVQKLLLQVRTQRGIDTLALAHEVENFVPDLPGSDHTLAGIARLLESHADANTHTSTGPLGEPMSLLSCAVMLGSTPLVKHLLHNGALVEHSRTALHYARGKAAFVAIQQQANEEMQHAVATENLKSIYNLLEAGVDPGIPLIRGPEVGHGNTLLMFSMELSLEDAAALMADLLARKADIEQQDGLGHTPLQAAIDDHVDQQLVGLLLAHRADVTVKDCDGQNVLMIAATRGSHQNIQLLLEAGADGDVKNKEGYDAALLAFLAVDSQSVHFLAKHGYALDRDIVLRELFSHLRGDTEKMIQLLDVAASVFPTIAGASADGLELLPHPHTSTLLMEAVQMNDVEIVVALLKHGAVLYPQLEVLGTDTNLIITADRLATANPIANVTDTSSDHTACSAWLLSLPNQDMKETLRQAFPHELLRVAAAANALAAANLREEEKHGLIVTKEELELYDTAGCNALDHFLMHGLAEFEIWLTERGGRFHGATAWAPALAEPAKMADAETVIRRLKSGIQVDTCDGGGRSAFDWCIISGNLCGLVWACVEGALVTSEQNQDDGSRGNLTFNLDADEHVYNPEAGDASEPVVMTLADLRAGGGAGIPGRRRQKGHHLEHRESNARPSILDKRMSSSNHHLGGVFEDDDRYSRSSRVDSFYGRKSAASTITSRTQGHTRRKNVKVKADPRGAHAAVEVALAEAGGHVFATRSATMCLREPLEFREFETVRRRIAAGADCETACPKTSTTLAHTALNMKSADLCCELVHAHADPDARDPKGKTLLWRAVEVHDPILIQACVNRNANLTLGITEKDESSVLHLALDTEQPDVALQLLKFDTSVSKDLVKKLDAHGRPPVWRAMELGYPQVARECFAHGADATIEDDATGRNLVHLALLQKHPEIVRELIRRGAQAFKADKSGQTPLMLAIRAHDNASTDLLLEAGAAPVDLNSGEVACAIEAKNFDLAERLVNMCPPTLPAFDAPSPSAGTLSKSSLSKHRHRASSSGSYGGERKASTSHKRGSRQQTLAPDDSSDSNSGSAIGSMTMNRTASSDGGRKNKRVQRMRGILDSDGVELQLQQQDARKSILMLGADKQSQRVCSVVMQNMLQVSLLERSVVAVSEELLKWVFEVPGEEAKRALAMEVLPSIIADDGSKAAALEIMSMGLPYTMVEALDKAAMKKPTVSSNLHTRQISKSPTRRLRIDDSAGSSESRAASRDRAASPSRPVKEKRKSIQQERNDRKSLIGIAALSRAGKSADGSEKSPSSLRKTGTLTLKAADQETNSVSAGEQDGSSNRAKTRQRSGSPTRPDDLPADAVSDGPTSGKVCRGCGHKFADNSKFCLECGQKLEHAPRDTKDNLVNSQEREEHTFLNVNLLSNSSGTEEKSANDAGRGRERSDTRRTSQDRATTPQKVRSVTMSQCSCGNVFLDDASFCRGCGAPRLEPQSSPVGSSGAAGASADEYSMEFGSEAEQP